MMLNKIAKSLVTASVLSLALSASLCAKKHKAASVKKEAPKMVGVVYNKEEAKIGVNEVYRKLEDLHKSLLKLNQQYEDLSKIYQTLPSYQIDWALIDKDPKDVQKMADESMRLINDHLKSSGSNRIPLKPLFNAGK